MRAVQALRLAQEAPAVYGPHFELVMRLAARMRAKVAAVFNETGLFYHLTETVCRAPVEWASEQQCAEEGCAPPCTKGCERNCPPDDAGCPAACAAGCAEQCRSECGGDEWLSHMVHADANPDDCDMLDDGACVRRLPEDYTGGRRRAAPTRRP